MMKVLSIAIPSYNSESYMANCIESLLIGGDDVEILIVNDGSKDNTGRIADEYAAKYPNVIRAIHQENGGHGEAVNTGLRNATGAYFKVVDSDDWVDPKAYKEILALLKQMLTEHRQLDMLVSNFVYDKQGASFKKVMNYRSVLPQNEIFTWDQIGHFKKGQYILMHSVIYRTQMLRDCELELPKHTFYVDNIFVYQPLPAVKTIYYLDVDFYHYFIGRNDQSVNEKVMIKRVDQQLRVNKLMIDYYDLSDKTIDSQQKITPVYVQLSGNHDDHIFYHAHSLPRRHQSGQAGRAVGILAVEQSPYVQKIALRTIWPCHDVTKSRLAANLPNCAIKSRKKPSALIDTRILIKRIKRPEVAASGLFYIANVSRETFAIMHNTSAINFSSSFLQPYHETDGWLQNISCQIGCDIAL